jgi:phosphoserine phosphatase
MSRFLVVCDVDSTLIDNEVIDLLAEEAGTGKQVAKITDRAMRGDLDFATSLSQRVATLRGLPISALTTVFEKISITNGAREIITAVHEAKGLIVAVSGGFHEILDPLGAELGLDDWVANRLEVIDGALTGRTFGPVIDANAKAAFLQSVAKKRRIELENVIAVGDGANDLAMMKVAGLSVAFCAKPAVRERADVTIDVRNLALVSGLFGRRAD